MKTGLYVLETVPMKAATEEERISGMCLRSVIQGLASICLLSSKTKPNVREIE